MPCHTKEASHHWLRSAGRSSAVVTRRTSSARTGNICSQHSSSNISPAQRCQGLQIHHPVRTPGTLGKQMTMAYSPKEWRPEQEENIHWFWGMGVGNIHSLKLNLTRKNNWFALIGLFQKNIQWCWEENIEIQFFQQKNCACNLKISSLKCLFVGLHNFAKM